MKLLAVDTATDACSAALWQDGECAERFALAPREHTRRLLPMVDELLAEAGLRLTGLDAIAFGRGPGSFTGLRIAVGVAQGLALGADLPVVAVSDLAALAHAGWRETGESHWLACLDARMGEVYAGRFIVESAQAVPQAEEVVVAPALLTPPGSGIWQGIGPGFAAYAEALERRLGARLGATLPDRLPRAGDLAALGAAMAARGETQPAEQAAPVYLRNNVAQTSAQREAQRRSTR